MIDRWHAAFITRTTLPCLLALIALTEIAPAAVAPARVANVMATQAGITGSERVTFPQGIDSVDGFSGALFLELPLVDAYGSAPAMKLAYRSSQCGRRPTSGPIDLDSVGGGWSVEFESLREVGYESATLWLYRSASSGVVKLLPSSEFPKFAGAATSPGTFYGTSARGTHRLTVNGNTAVIATLDGTVREFKRLSDGRWSISSLTDVNGARVDVTYEPHRIVIVNAGREVALAFGTQGAGAAATLVLQGVSVSRNGIALDASRQMEWSNTVPDTPCDASATPVLTRIVAPSEPATDTTFRYVTSGSFSGRLSGYTHAYGGSVDYQWTRSNLRRIELQNGLIPERDRDLTRSFPMVQSRTVVDQTSVPTTGSFGLGYANERVFPGNSTMDDTRVVRVDAPSGRRSELRFAAHWDDLSQQSGGLSSGAPSAPGGNYGRLGQAGPPGTLLKAAGRSAGTGALVYELQLAYAEVATGPVTASFVSERRHVYHDDGGRWSASRFDHAWDGSAVDESEVDGFGQAQQLVATRLLGTAAPPAVGEPWIGRGWASKVTTVGSDSRLQERCSDAAGRTTIERDLAAGSPTPRDQVRRFSFDAAGAMTRIEYYRGSSWLAPTSICSQTPASGPEFELVITGSAGSSMGEMSSNLTGSPPLISHESLESPDARVSSFSVPGGVRYVVRRDGMSTSYSKFVQNRGEVLLRTRVFADAAASTGIAGYRVAIVTSMEPGSPAQTVLGYSGFGTALGEYLPAPVSRFAHERDIDGRLVAVHRADGSSTRFSLFDAMDRPAQEVVLRPGAQSLTTENSYVGARVTRQKSRLAVDPTSRPVVWFTRETETIKNARGQRLSQTTRDDGAVVRTAAWTYDINGVSTTTTNGVVSAVSALRDHNGAPIADGHGRPITIDARGRPTVQYNHLGQPLARENHVSGQVARLSWNGQSLLLREFDEYGRTTRSWRRSRGLVDFAGQTLDVDVRTQYADADVVRRRVTVSDGAGVALWEAEASRTLDGDGRVVQESTPSCLGSALVSCVAQSAVAVGTYDDLGLTSLDWRVGGGQQTVYLLTTRGNPEVTTYRNGTALELSSLDRTILASSAWRVRDAQGAWHESGVPLVQGSGQLIGYEHASSTDPEFNSASLTLPSTPVAPMSPVGVVDQLGELLVGPETRCGQFQRCNTIYVRDADGVPIALLQKPVPATMSSQIAVVSTELRPLMTDGRTQATWHSNAQWLRTGPHGVQLQQISAGHMVEHPVHLGAEQFGRCTTVGTNTLVETIRHLDAAGRVLATSDRFGKVSLIDGAPNPDP